MPPAPKTAAAAHPAARSSPAPSSGQHRSPPPRPPDHPSAGTSPTSAAAHQAASASTTSTPPPTPPPNRRCCSDGQTPPWGSDTPPDPPQSSAGHQGGGGDEGVDGAVPGVDRDGGEDLVGVQQHPDRGGRGGLREGAVVPAAAAAQPVPPTVGCEAGSQDQRGFGEAVLGQGAAGRLEDPVPAELQGVRS